MGTAVATAATACDNIAYIALIVKALDSTTTVDHPRRRLRGDGRLLCRGSTLAAGGSHLNGRAYSNFADEIGEGEERELPQVGEADFARFKQKARHFLKAHEDHLVLHKLRQGRPLTATDLGELEKMLLDAGVGQAGDIERARKTSQGFGRFVRSLVGLDRATVSAAFDDFLSAGTATATQIEFINMVIEHLTDQGVMDPGLLYEPPFTDIAPTGPDQVFGEERVTRLFAKIEELNKSAVA